jgi:hypothetical protein
MKYKTLKELSEAYKSGELGKDDRLILDNDTAHVYKWIDEDNGEYVFRSEPHRIIEEALEILGISWEYA